VRVLVTGATGLLGHAVTSTLATRGHTVITLSRNDTDVPDAADHHITADVRSSADMRSAVAEVDAVCHLAALVQVRDSINRPLEYWKTNVVGTLNVLDALTLAAKQDAPKRLILSSTGAVYGAPDRQPISEDEPSAPSNPYAATKLAADMAASHAAAASGAIGATSLRAFNIAGASTGRTDLDMTRLIPKILAVQAGEADELVINGEGSAVRDFVHVEDMADAFARALDACTPGKWHAYNIGSGRRTTVREVIETATAVTGRPVPVRHAPPAAEPPVLVADASRAMAELSWHPEKSDLKTILTDAWHVMSNR
jgi:UDP-glucose 4-epimerase